MSEPHPSADALRSILADLNVFMDHELRYRHAKNREWIIDLKDGHEVLRGRREIPVALVTGLRAARLKLRDTLEQCRAAACFGWSEELRAQLQELCEFTDKVSHELLTPVQSAERIYRSGWGLPDWRAAIETALRSIPGDQAAAPDRPPAPTLEPDQDDELERQRLAFALSLWNAGKTWRQTKEATNAKAKTPGNPSGWRMVRGDIKTFTRQVERFAEKHELFIRQGKPGLKVQSDCQ